MAETNWTEWLVGQGFRPDLRSGSGKLESYMGDLSKNYGLGEQDFTKAFQAYGAQYSPGAMDENNNGGYFANDPGVAFWNEQATLRALGQGLDQSNPNAAYKGSWNNYWNQGAETAQQNEAASAWEQGRDKSTDFEDLGDILKGVGIVTGVGGLAGAFGGGLGLPGADVVGSDWAAGLSSAMNPGSAASGIADAVGNFVPAEAAGGTVSGSGGGMDFNDLLDSIVGDNSGYTVNNIPTGDAWNGAMNTGGSDWASGLDTAMNAGNQGATGFLDQAKSLLSQGKNIPTSLVKSLFGTDDATSATLSRLIGTGLGGLLDYKASSGQADALKAIADRSWAAGQPYRDRANAAMTPGFDIKSIPGLSSAMDTATDTYLRRLSATNGNPAGIGAAPSQTQAFVLGNVALPAWQNYFNANSNAGGLSNLSAQSGTTATQAAGADAATYGSLGQTARNIFSPAPDNSQYLNLLAKAYGLA